MVDTGEGFHIDPITGFALISFSRYSEIINVRTATVKSYLYRNHPELDTSEGLTPEAVKVCTLFFAMESRRYTEEAQDLLRKLTDEGTKAYMYKAAGHPYSVFSVIDSSETTMSMLARLAGEIEELNSKICKIATQEAP